MEEKVDRIIKTILNDNNKTSKSLEKIVCEVDKENCMKLLNLVSIKLADIGYDIISTNPIRVNKYLI